MIDMNEKTPEESFKKHISIDDLSSFEWRILKYMCSVTGIYDTFPEILLFHRTDLKASIDSKFSQEYLQKEGGAVYKFTMNNVMGSLIDRNAVEIVTEYEYGNLNMALYGRKKKLKEMCDELKKYEIKDFVLIDKLFSKNV
jgi:hypothetical protein